MAPAEREVWLDLPRFHAVLDALTDHAGVRLTFDDGNASDAEHALPALRARGMRATFFVVAGRLGMPGFLDEQHVRALADAGMTIGCHGMHHRRWRQLDDCALHEEIVDARLRLEEVVQRPVTQAACPFGAYDRRVLRSLRRGGYEHVFTSDRGTAAPGAWLQARNTVRHGDDVRLLDGILGLERSRGERLRRGAKRSVKRWR